MPLALTRTDGQAILLAVQCAVVAALVFAACGSSTRSKHAPREPAPKPAHAIRVALNLTMPSPWEAGPEPGGCQGAGQFDDLKIGTPVQVSSGGKKLGSATVTMTKNLVSGCALIATIDAVPAAAEYSFQFGDYQGMTASYASVAKNWNVVVSF